MSHAPHFAEFRTLLLSPLDTIDSWSSLLGINRAGTGQFNPPYRPFDIERPFEFHECGYAVRENPYMLIWRRVPNQPGEELEPGAELWMQYIRTRNPWTAPSMKRTETGAASSGFSHR